MVCTIPSKAEPGSKESLRYPSLLILAIRLRAVPVTSVKSPTMIIEPSSSGKISVIEPLVPPSTSNSASKFPLPSSLAIPFRVMPFITVNSPASSKLFSSSRLITSTGPLTLIPTPVSKKVSILPAGTLTVSSSTMLTLALAVEPITAPPTALLMVRLKYSVFSFAKSSRTFSLISCPV